MTAAADPGGSRSKVLPSLIAGVLIHDDLAEILQSVLSAAATLGVAATSIALAEGQPPTLRLLAASDERASHLVHHEASVDQGPSLQLLMERDSEHEPDGGNLDRWPRYRAEARSLGIVAALAFPLHARSHEIGTLVVYGTEAIDFAADDRAFAQALADIVVLGLLQIRAADLHEDAVGLRQTLADYTAIEQANGMIAELRDTSIREAMLALRSRSKATDRSMAAVARSVANRDEDPRAWPTVP